MEEIIRLLTPQNFAMIIAIYLLVRFEKTIASLDNNIDRMDKNLCGCIDRNTRVLGILIDRARKPGENSRCDAAIRELTEESEKNELQIGI